MSIREGGEYLVNDQLVDAEGRPLEGRSKTDAAEDAPQDGAPQDGAPQDGAPAEGAPWDDYDSMSVADVQQYLEDHPDVDLDAVRAYEERNQARKGVLENLE